MPFRRRPVRPIESWLRQCRPTPIAAGMDRRSSAACRRFPDELRHDVELQLHPGSLIGFELAAGKEHGRSRVRVRLTWREDPGSGAPTDVLKISSK